MLADQLKSVVLENVARVKVLKDFGIEYSSDRDKTLEEIADSKGLDLYALVRELSEASDFKQLKKSDFKHWTQILIIEDILLPDHNSLREAKEYFLEKGDTLFRDYRKKTPKMLELRDLLRNMMEDIATHIDREENTLFPAIKHIEYKGKDNVLMDSSLFSSVITLIQNHEHSNNDVELIQKSINQILITSNLNTEIEDFCMEVRGLCNTIKKHIFVEDEVLFKMVVEM